MRHVEHRAPRWLGRILAILVVMLSAVAAAKENSPGGAPAEAGPNQNRKPGVATWYAMALGQVAGRPAVGHFWSKGSKFRSETVLFGRPILTLVDGGFYYTIDVMDGTGLAVQRSPLAIEQDAERARPFAVEWEEMVEAGGEKVRTEKAGNNETEIWRLTNVSGRQTIWVSAKEPKLVLRVETYDRESSATDQVEYVNWQFGMPIPDSFFQPGSSVRIRRMEYGKYIEAARKGPVGPAPPLYRHLLHGRQKPKN